jgi:hypothetical protein
MATALIDTHSTITADEYERLTGKPFHPSASEVAPARGQSRVTVTLDVPRDRVSETVDRMRHALNAAGLSGGSIRVGRA